MVGNLIARREADADQRGGADGIGAGILGGGEADFHKPVFRGNDMAEAECGFGSGDEALAGNHERREKAMDGEAEWKGARMPGVTSAEVLIGMAGPDTGLQ